MGALVTGKKRIDAASRMVFMSDVVALGVYATEVDNWSIATAAEDQAITAEDNGFEDPTEELTELANDNIAKLEEVRRLAYEFICNAIRERGLAT
jgi:hypothetical protein